MKKVNVLMMTAVFVLLLIGVTVVVPTVTTAATDVIRVYVDDVEIKFPDQNPFINKDNRTMVPVRFVSNALGSNVEWVESAKMVVIKHEGETILLTVGENFARIGTKQISLDTSATIVNNRTMIPLRFVSECLGGNVYWNSRERKIFITTKLPPVNEFNGIQFKPEDLPLVDGGTQIILSRSDRPSARIQYVKASELPIKLSNHYTIYNLTVNEEYISIKQYCDVRIPIDLYMVEDGQLNRSRLYSNDFQENTIFTYKYPVQSRIEQATGEKPVDLRKISGFAVSTIVDGNFRMLVIENPLYRGGK